MKTLILSLSVLVVSIHFSFGQETTKQEFEPTESIIYNFETKEPIDIHSVTYGETSVFRIENINKFLYEVEIETKQTEYHTEIPVAFKVLMQEEKSTTNLKDKEKEFLSVGVSPDEATKINNIKNAEYVLAKTETSLDLAVDQKLDAETNNIMDVVELEKTIASLKESIANQKKEIESLNAAITDEYLIAIEALLKQVEIVRRSFDTLEQVKCLKNDLITISERDDLTHERALHETDKLESKLSANKSSDPVMKFDKEYRQFMFAYQMFLIDEAVQKKFGKDQATIKARLAPLLNEIESLKEMVDKTKYNEILDDAKTLYDQLRSANNYIAVSAPVQAQKDEVTFLVKIEPRKNINSSLNLENKEFSICTPIRGGVKIDFSTGLLYTRSLYNRSYYLTPSANDSAKSTISEGRNNSFGQVSLGALMHVSPRWTYNFKPSFCFGVGLNSTDISNANFFFGGSCIIGSRERFIISSGISVAPVDYLKGRYDLNVQYTTSDIESALTEKTLKSSWFVSFTYNLTNKPKE